MHVVYVMTLLVVYSFFCFMETLNKLINYKGTVSIFCDYCLLNVHVLIYIF